MDSAYRVGSTPVLLVRKELDHEYMIISYFLIRLYSSNGNQLPDGIYK